MYLIVFLQLQTNIFPPETQTEMIISQFGHRTEKNVFYTVVIEFIHFRSFMLKILEGAITSRISDY
jgi:hypothetical protein